VTLTRFRYYPPKEDDKRLDSLAKLRMRRIDRDGTGELVTAIRPAFCEEHVKRGQRSKLYVLELHELRLSQRQSFQKRVRLVYRRHIQQEDRTLLILACPPLLNSLLRDGGEELRELPLGRSS
jgi:hypothetical protein